MSDPTRKVAIVTDSISSLTQAMGQEYGIHVVPVYVGLDDRTYRDGIDLDAEQFYRLLRDSKQLPTTFQPTVTDFARLYADLSWRAEAIVSIHTSERVSATVNSAQAACSELPGVPIHVIDSRTLSMGLGLVAIAAARAANAGWDAAQIVWLVEKLLLEANVIFTVETLEYLDRGGRIGGATALLDSALHIKPILHIEDGQVEPLGKSRTRKQALEHLLDLMAERVGSSPSVHAAVLHCDALDEAGCLVERVEARFRCAELLSVEAGPIIAIHAGPGTVGVAFYAA